MSPSRKSPRPTIARIGRGRTTAVRADEYAQYLYEHGIRPLEKKALGVQLFREDRAAESEFVTISYWESVAAMSRFAGPDPRRIHHLERDPEFLIELPKGVQVLTIAAQKGVLGSRVARIRACPSRRAPALRVDVARQCTGTCPRRGRRRAARLRPGRERAVAQEQGLGSAEGQAEDRRGRARRRATRSQGRDRARRRRLRISRRDGERARRAAEDRRVLAHAGRRQAGR